MSDMFSKAASLIRKAGADPIVKTTMQGYKQIGQTVKDVAVRHTPVGVGMAAVGLYKDKKAQKKSEAGLNNVRAQAAAKLRQMNRQTKTLKAAVPMKNITMKTVTMPQHSQFSSTSTPPVLTNKQIADIKASSTLSEAGKNARFEQDMRKRQSLGLPR